MSDKPKEQDPFRPQEPNIPGVTGNPARLKPAPEPPRPVAPQFRNSGNDPERISTQRWLAIAVVTIVVISSAALWWKHENLASQTQTVPSVAPVVDLPPAAAAQPVAQIPVGPGPVATTGELAKTWSSKRFVFRVPETSDDVPALVVHLPDDIYWGLSLREPFGNCELEYVTDLPKLERGFDFHAEHPMIVDPCNRAVYDLTRYGAGPNGVVRGAIVSGQGVRPPMAIEIKIHGKQVVASRLEH